MGYASLYHVVFNMGCSQVQGRPFWVKPNLENAFLLCGSSLAREPTVLGGKRVRCSEWEHRDLIKGSGGDGSI
jgi:hypothetical protein